MEKLSQGRTTIIIAHRLETVKQEDRIYVLTDQGIVKEGTHQELLHLKGIYSDLYRENKANERIESLAN